MKKLVLFIFMFLLLLSLVGCSIEPSSPDDTLVIGQVTIEAIGHPIYGTSTSVNGTHKNNITITFQNIITSKEYQVTTNNYGFFYKRDLKEGSYNMKKFYFKNYDGNRWAATWRNFRDLIIKVEPGKVMNVGYLLWYSNKEESSYRITQTGSPAELYDLFKTNFPTSKWLEREWVNITF